MRRRDLVLSASGYVIALAIGSVLSNSAHAQGGGGQDAFATATLSEAPIIAGNALIYPADNPILLILPPDLG